jgi:hypothetical protein
MAFEKQMVLKFLIVLKYDISPFSLIPLSFSLIPRREMGNEKRDISKQPETFFDKGNFIDLR